MQSIPGDYFIEKGGMDLDDLILGFRASIDDDEIQKAFPLVSEEEVPIWMGSPSFPSYIPKYSLALIVFLIHFSFYLIVVTDYSSEEKSYLNGIIRLLDWLFDLVDVFAFIFVMLIFARLNFYLNITTSTIKNTVFLVFIGLIPAFWWFANIIDWILVILRQDQLNIPEWFDQWFLLLGIINSLILLIPTIISQFSFTYLITDQNLHFRERHFIFYKSYNKIGLHELENLMTQQSIFGKIFGFGNILPILDDNSEVISNPPIERSIPQIFYRMSKFIIFHQRNLKVASLPPSKCFFGINKPMIIYQLVNELMDSRNGRPDLITDNS